MINETIENCKTMQRISDLLDITMQEQSNTKSRQHTLMISIFLATCVLLFALFMTYLAAISNQLAVACIIAVICCSYIFGINALINEIRGLRVDYKNLAYKRNSYLKRLQELLAEDV